MNSKAKGASSRNGALLTKGGSLPSHATDVPQRGSDSAKTARVGRNARNTHLLHPTSTNLANENPSHPSVPDGKSKDDDVRLFLERALLRRVSLPEEDPQLSFEMTVADHDCVAKPTVDGGVAPQPDGYSSLAYQVPAWKRFLDLSLIGLTLPFWLPVMLLVMLAVRFSSPGPVFFKQRRVGRGGRIFMIYKFRSMRVNADTAAHESYFQHLMRNGVPMAKLDVAGDPRIIPWGRLIRATGLDELPQIFNVIEGEMSLVGPRPCTAQEFEHFNAHERQRVATLPGLTGLWQVSGKNSTTFDEMIRLDVHYAQNLSLRRDLTIIARTFPTLWREALKLRQGRAPAPSNARRRSAPAQAGQPANAI